MRPTFPPSNPVLATRKAELAFGLPLVPARFSVLSLECGRWSSLGTRLGKTFLLDRQDQGLALTSGFSTLSFRYWPVLGPAVCNACTAIGFTSLNAILGGQTLSLASKGTVSWSLGIVLVALIGLLVRLEHP